MRLREFDSLGLDDWSVYKNKKKKPQKKLEKLEKLEKQEKQEKPIKHDDWNLPKGQASV
jgi:hypothetical protein